MNPEAILDSMSDSRTTGLYILYEERVPLVRCRPPFFLVSKRRVMLIVRIELPDRNSGSETKEIIHLILLLSQIQKTRTPYPVLRHPSHL